MSMDVSDLLSGRGLSVEVGGRTFWVRPPTPEEYDDALHLQNVVRKRLLQTPEIAELRSLPPSDEARATLLQAIADAEREYEALEATDPERELLARRLAALRTLQEKRTLADEVAEERAILARDRWLTLRLLTDEQGQPIVPPEQIARDSWHRLPLAVREAARPLIWIMLRMIEELPFGSAQPRASNAR